MVDKNSEVPETFGVDISVPKLNTPFFETIKKSLADHALILEIIEPMIDGVVIINGEFGVFEANSSFCNMLGYSHEEILELHVWDWDTSFSSDEIKQMSRALKDTCVHFEVVQKRKDGSIITVEIQGQSFEYKNAIWQLCLCRDINTHKKTEENLQISEHNLYETQRIAHIGSWELNLETNHYSSSDEMKRIWGVPENSLTEIRSLADKIHPEDADKLDKAINRSIEEGIPYDIEYRIIDGHGDLRFLHSLSKITKNAQGKPIHIYGICQDITERKKNEDDRRLNELRLLQTQKIAHIGTYEFNLKENKLWWSDELFRIFGIEDKKEITPDEYMDYIHPDDVDSLKERLVLGQEDYHIEYRIIRSDGEVRYLSTFVGKHEYKDGEQYIIRGTGQDITEQKLIELEKNKLELQLNHAQKMETIGTLAGGVAHDINNILGIIIGNTELSLDDVPEWNPAYSNLKEIVKAVLRAKEVIRQLLTFSRNMDMKKETIDVVSVVKDALKFLRSTISTTIEIEKDINVPNPNIVADPTQINQIIMNLCVNSAQAMEGSSGLIKVKVENITINHVYNESGDVLPNGEYVKIVISDTGPGIPPAIHEKIFDPYFTTKEVGKGSGMGLAVVQGIVKKHKGSINVKSMPGKGTTFTILLPVINDRIVVQGSEVSNSTKGKKILFVDDEEQIVKIGSRMLESLGYVVDPVTSPLKALELLKKEPDKYDLIVTDMAMPNMDAIMLFKEVRKIREDIPVVLSSGHNPLMDDNKAEETGFSGYILKPFTKAELTAVIKKAFVTRSR